MNNAALVKGLNTAFIDKNIESDYSYRPQFISNNHLAGRKVLTTIEAELSCCESFDFSVAFVTMSGITPLLETFKELEDKGIPGRILTTDYLNFSEPKALAKLKSLSNIEIKMYDTKIAKEGFHTKGFMFKNGDTYRILVGSSNLTLGALTTNKEWNTKIVSTKQGEYADEVISEFSELWNSECARAYDDFIEEYSLRYEISKKQREIAADDTSISLEAYKLTPNSMQVSFVDSLKNIMSTGESKALLISATGTGKTYASAFALRDIDPKKALFIVHREQIAKQAIKSYKKVFGRTKSFGLLSGNSRELNADFLFSTMQMMAKDEIRSHFDKDEFDIIVIDEVHRAGATSYKKIMEYFEPKFWIGMTASPDRTDGFDIYGLFDHNIAQEIRLQQALENQLLCPFHYFGITDLEIDGEVFDDETGIRNFRYLVSDNRVNHILEKAEYFGYSGDRVKGLIFCSRKDEASVLSSMFNERGYRTTFLCGEDSQERREDCIRRLESDDSDDQLDYIFTVDIFNEGVDIPAVNQILMLRPTESPIIFVQQLGRGLRKADNKEYVIILDFIGNYFNNYMIPLALSGDRTYNKDTVRKYVREGTRVIPGSSTIHFDEISKKRIFSSIDQANFNDIKLIKESYQQLKYKLGHVPSLMDFEIHGSIDPIRIFDNNSLGSYHAFLKKYEKQEYKIEFNKNEELFLEYVSKKFASGKRPHELLAIKYLMDNGYDLISYLSNKLTSQNIVFNEKTKTNIVNMFTNNYATGTGKDTYSSCVFIKQVGDRFVISDEFARLLCNVEFKNALSEVVEFGLFRNQKYYASTYPNSSFQLYSKYTYDDVCRLLNWEKGEVALNIGGYKYDKKTKTYPVFINYDKTEDIADTIKYEDRLESPSLLTAISKSGRTVDSDDVQTALNADSLGVVMDLFVRKNKDDKISKEFYYLGRIHATGETRQFIMPGTEKTAVEIKYSLETPVRDDIYDYIIS